ncbi:hypothetical protein Zm00014a_032515, partial [Zea mays]
FQPLIRVLTFKRSLNIV